MLSFTGMSLVFGTWHVC